MDLEKNIYRKIGNTSLMKSINKFYNMFTYDRMIFFLIYPIMIISYIRK